VSRIANHRAVFVLGGFILIQLGSGVRRRIFSQLFIAVTVGMHVQRFAFVIWIMPIYGGLMLVVSASMESPKTGGKK